MTVYEIIQELSKYSADTEVAFHVTADYTATGEAEFERENESDTQTVDVDVEFDNDVEFDGIEDREHKVYQDIVINFKY